MKRRSFFKNLLGTAAAIAVASAVECFGVTDKIVEVAKKAKEIIVNPAYFTAQYEDVVIFHPVLKKVSHVIRSYTWATDQFENHRIHDPRAPRYNLENGEWIRVPFYKEI